MKEPMNLNGAIITDAIIDAIKDWQDEGSEFDIEALRKAKKVILKQDAVLNRKWDKAIDFLRLVRLLEDLEERIEVFAAKKERGVLEDSE